MCHRGNYPTRNRKTLHPEAGFIRFLNTKKMVTSSVEVDVKSNSNSYRWTTIKIKNIQDWQISIQLKITGRLWVETTTHRFG